MDGLADLCNNLSLETASVAWYNNTEYELYIIYADTVDYVYTATNIYEGRFIGNIEGKNIPTHDWNSYTENTFILNDTISIDYSGSPRCITSMIRRGADYNCSVEYVFNDTNGIDVFIMANKHIYSGQELVINDAFIEIYM